MSQQLDQHQKSKSGFFYGYIIAIVAFWILFISYGLRFSYGVFFTPMVTDMGWDNATTSLAFSISMLVEGISALVMGGLTDKYGPRLIITVSGALLSLGYCLMPLVNSIWQLYLFYGLFVGVGVGGIFVPLVSTIPRWFKARRALMVGLVGTGLSIGILILAPLTTRLIETVGWRNAFFIIGIISLVMILIPAQFLKLNPASKGLAPFGENKPLENAQTMPAQGLSLKEAIRTAQFWIIAGMLFCFGFNAMVIGIFVVPDAIRAGISAAVAATILSVLGGFQIAGRIGLGIMADRIGNNIIFIIGFIVTGIALPLLITNSALWSFYVFVLIYGIVHGGFYSAEAPLLASVFGLKAHGIIFGSCGIGFTLGASLGPYIAGLISDHTQSYKIAFIVCEFICVLGLVLTLVLKPFKGSRRSTTRL